MGGFELEHAVKRASLGFVSLGVSPGDVVAYQLPNWWEAVVVFLAAARIGAVVNPLLPIFRGLVRTPEAERDMDAIMKSRDALSRSMAMLDRYLGETAYLGGDDFSMGDIPAGIGTYRWFHLPIEREDYPNVKRWYDALTTRAGYQQHILITME